MMKFAKLLILTALLSSAACQQAAVADDNAGNAATPSSAEPPMVDPGGGRLAPTTPQVNATDTSPVMDRIHPIPGTAAGTFPMEFRGRWGMVPADCTSTRGDAKGLITIGEEMIRFYESTGTITEQLPAGAHAYSAKFHFKGEGAQWDKTINFLRDGDALKLTHNDGSFSYRRCA